MSLKIRVALPIRVRFSAQGPDTPDANRQRDAIF